MDDVITRGFEVSLHPAVGMRACANRRTKRTQNRFGPEHISTASMSYLKAVLVGVRQAAGCAGGKRSRVWLTVATYPGLEKDSERAELFGKAKKEKSNISPPKTAGMVLVFE